MRRDEKLTCRPSFQWMQGTQWMPHLYDLYFAEWTVLQNFRPYLLLSTDASWTSEGFTVCLAQKATIWTEFELAFGNICQPAKQIFVSKIARLLRCEKTKQMFGVPVLGCLDGIYLSSTTHPRPRPQGMCGVNLNEIIKFTLFLFCQEYCQSPYLWILDLFLGSEKSSVFTFTYVVSHYWFDEVFQLAGMKSGCLSTLGFYYVILSYIYA